MPRPHLARQFAAICVFRGCSGLRRDDPRRRTVRRPFGLVTGPSRAKATTGTKRTDARTKRFLFPAADDGILHHEEVTDIFDRAKQTMIPATLTDWKQSSAGAGWMAGRGLDVLAPPCSLVCYGKHGGNSLTADRKFLGS